jgi:hypothetical protein
MKTNQFYARRMPATTSEPNYSGAEPGRAPGAGAMRIARLAVALGVAVLTGLAFGPAALVVALVASGAALVLAACLFAKSE